MQGLLALVVVAVGGAEGLRDAGEVVVLRARSRRLGSAGAGAVAADFGRVRDGDGLPDVDLRGDTRGGSVELSGLGLDLAQRREDAQLRDGGALLAPERRGVELHPFARVLALGRVQQRRLLHGADIEHHVSEAMILASGDCRRMGKVRAR